MLKWLATLLNIFSIIFSWSTLFLTIWFFVRAIKSITEHRARFKNWLTMILCVLYIASFLICRIFFFSVFESLWGTVSIIVIIICMSLSWYEDCCNGKRWWNW